MTLNTKNRNIIVNHRFQRAQETLEETKKICEIGLWHSAANRLYYACYYAVTALLIKNGYFAHTHNGVLTLLGKHFVLEGIISKKQNELYRKIFELRQKGDYGDWVIIDEQIMKPLIEPAEQFIKTIEKLINQTT